MDTAYRSFSTMNIQSSRDYPTRSSLSSETIEYSSLISSLHLLINIESFFRKLCEITPPPSKFCGKIKKMLTNFKSDNFSGISTIVPNSFRLTDQKPGLILNNVLEDFRTCTEISLEKRPDSLFLYGSGGFLIKISITRLLEQKISDILDVVLLNTRVLPQAIAIDLVWDQAPTCEKILQILSNLTNWKNFDLSGLACGFGFLFTSYIKNFDQWKNHTDSKVLSWLNLVWTLVISSNYPVLLIYSQNTNKSNPCIIPKIDYEGLLRFAKLQDQKIKISFKEDPPKEINIAKNYLESKIEPRYQENKDKIKQYIDENRLQREEISRQDIRNNIENKNEEKRLAKVDYELRNYKEFKEDRLPAAERAREYVEERRTPAYIEEKRIRDELIKEEPRPYTVDKFYRDKIYSERLKEDSEEKPSDFRKSIQDFSEIKYSKDPPTTYNENLTSSRSRNFSTDPESFNKSKQTSMASSRPYAEDYIYSNSRNLSVGPKESQSRPGILKNSSNENPKNLRFPSNNYTPIISPKESLSRTFRESTLPERYDEEITDKPNSILKNSWLSEKDYNPRSSRIDPAEKKVNFSDNVFRIEDSNKDQMPEIKIVSMKIPKNQNSKSSEYVIEDFKYSNHASQRPLNEYKNYIAPDYKSPVKSDSKIVDSSNKWTCPKCSASISNESYECSSCRFINWDKFYALKSRSPKLRSESIPAKNNEREEIMKKYRPLIENRNNLEGFDVRGTPNKEVWRSSNREDHREIKVTENFSSEDYSRRRDLLFNR